MSITAVRLQPVDKRRNFGMRTYVSANSRTKYTSGTDRNPSPFRVVNNAREIAELATFPQFEILEFDDMGHLREFIQGEMENRARIGLPAVRAAVMTGVGAGRAIEDERKPRKTVIDRLPAAVSGPASDPARTNTGRQPAPQAAQARTAPATPAETPAKAAKPVPKAEPKTAKKSKPLPKAPAKAKKKGKKASRKRSTRPASDND